MPSAIQNLNLGAPAPTESTPMLARRQQQREHLRCLKLIREDNTLSFCFIIGFLSPLLILIPSGAYRVLGAPETKCSFIRSVVLSAADYLNDLNWSIFQYRCTGKVCRAAQNNDVPLEDKKVCRKPDSPCVLLKALSKLESIALTVISLPLLRMTIALILVFFLAISFFYVGLYANLADNVQRLKRRMENEM